MRRERQHQSSPFKVLGSRLKNVRVSANETLAEVSGAVEIDMDIMQRIENGDFLPSEEILLLLISHFEIEGDEAANLWDLAGYGLNHEHLDENSKISGVLSPEDIKISYTDMTHITSNKYGVVMNFLQSTGAGDHPILISRVGMSREQAQNILENLQKQLHQPKLPNSTPKKRLVTKNKKTDIT